MNMMALVEKHTLIHQHRQMEAKLQNVTEKNI